MAAKTDEKPAETTSNDEEKQAKCDNHPHRNATTFDQGGAIVPINLCEECTPEWFRSDDDKS